MGKQVPCTQTHTSQDRFRTSMKDSPPSDPIIRASVNRSETTRMKAPCSAGVNPDSGLKDIDRTSMKDNPPYPIIRAGVNIDLYAKHAPLNPIASKRVLPDDFHPFQSQNYSIVPKEKKPKSMIQGKNITINGGKLTNVGGDYHEHNTTYVVEESTTCATYFKVIVDMIKQLDTQFTSPKQDNTTSDDSKETFRDPSSHPRHATKDNDSRQTVRDSPLHPPHATKSDDSKQILQDSPPLPHPRQEVMVDEIRFNSLNDPPQPASELHDGYCIYQTSTPTRTNTFASNSATYSGTAHISPSETQNPYPFGRAPGLIPGIMHRIPCWLPTWGGWIASTAWIAHPPWVWPSFL